MGGGGGKGLFYGTKGSKKNDGIKSINLTANKVNYRESNLDKAFGKHSSDFGNYPNGSKVSKESFKNDIDNLLKTGIQKSGTYRATEGTHVYDPKTHIWAFFDSNKNFITAFKLGLAQYKYLIETGVVK